MTIDQAAYTGFSEDRLRLRTSPTFIASGIIARAARGEYVAPEVLAAQRKVLGLGVPQSDLYLRGREQAGLSWPIGGDMPNGDVYNRVFQQEIARVQGGYVGSSEMARGVPDPYDPSTYLPIGAGAGLTLLGIGAGMVGSYLGGGSGTEIVQAGYQGRGTFADPAGTGPVAGIQVGGPGVPEPPKNMVVREWRTTVYSNTYGYMHCYFFALADGRIMMWHSKRNYWKVWRPKKNIVLPRGRTTLSQAVKAQRYLDRMWRTVAKRTKALKLA